MAGIHISDIEAAINYWRARQPIQPGAVLGEQVAALASVYARMALVRAIWVDVAELDRAAMMAWLDWYQTTPDTPCIAICSTTQGDAQCKGCGRTLDEVQHWPALDPVAKRAVWQRIATENVAWRFSRYAERGG